jgi:hypothetical protein
MKLYARFDNDLTVIVDTEPANLKKYLDFKLTHLSKEKKLQIARSLTERNKALEMFTRTILAVEFPTSYGQADPDSFYLKDFLIQFAPEFVKIIFPTQATEIEKGVDSVTGSE